MQGNPLPEQRLIQNVVGICKSDDMSAPVKFRLVLGERLAGKVNIPLNVPVKFRANVAQTQNQEGWLLLNPYSRIQFAEAKLDLDPEAVINDYFGDYIVSVEDLEDWHKEHENDKIRWCIVYGDVSDVDPTPNASTGNARVSLTDDTGEVETTGWVPGHLVPLVNFGVGSKAFINGRSAQQTRDGQVRTFINCEGLFAPPKDRIAPDEEPENVAGNAESVN
jgi:hypothetical protein